MHLRIPLSDLDFGAEEAAAVQRVVQSKWLSMGPETQAFEAEFAERMGVRHAIAVSNGTAALHLAYLALGIGPGDAVIQPAVNFVAAANMTLATGATPLYADICSLAEPTISPESIERLLATLDDGTTGPQDDGTTGPISDLPSPLSALPSPISALPSPLRPKAVLVMHYGGYFCRMAEILEICRKHGLFLIEDACHAVGAHYTPPSDLPSSISDLRSPISNLPASAAGALGDIGCFSFFSNKNMVTGEGGMVTTNRDDLADRIRLLRSHGMTSLSWDRHRGHAATYDVAAHGYNYRLDDLRSALGREQLKKLERNNQRRRDLTALYWEKLAPLAEKGWTLPFRDRSLSSVVRGRQSVACGPWSGGQQSGAPPSPISNLPSSPTDLPSAATAAHVLPTVAPDVETRWRCADALKDAGIQTSLHYPFIPGFSAFEGSAEVSHLALAREFCSRVITLPLFPTMTEEQVELVCQTLKAEAGRGAEIEDRR